MRARAQYGRTARAANVAVTVMDTNDQPTILSNPQTLRVPENFVGGIGRYLADDEDCCFSAVDPSWGLLSFAIDDTTYLEFETLAFADAKTSPNVSAISTFDYESSATYSLGVTVTDGGGLQQTGTLNIEVINVNDAPVFSGFSCPLTAYVSDSTNALEGDIITTVEAHDDDTLNVFADDDPNSVWADLHYSMTLLSYIDSEGDDLGTSSDTIAGIT